MPALLACLCLPLLRQNSSFQLTPDELPNHVGLEVVCLSAKDRSEELHSWAFPCCPHGSACFRAGLGWGQSSLWGWLEADDHKNYLLSMLGACLRAGAMCSATVHGWRCVHCPQAPQKFLQVHSAQGTSCGNPGTTTVGTTAPQYRPHSSLGTPS